MLSGFQWIERASMILSEMQHAFGGHAGRGHGVESGGGNKQEKIFYSKGNVTVTNARFIVSKQVFAMRNITSIKLDEDKPSRTVPAFLILTGIVGLFFGRTVAPYAASCIALGAAWYALQKSQYHVLITSSSGESRPLSSKNKKWIKSVVAALNESIVHRG